MKNKWNFKEINIEEIVPAELNANEMSEKDLDLLTSNIGKSGLSSVITCFRRTLDGKYEIISGHHRYRAAVKNGYVTVPCLYADETELSRDEIIAIQLSHNSLHGEDNKGILKRLFEQIQSIDFKEMAHIDMDEIGNIETFSGSVVPMQEHYPISFILYKNDIDILDDLIGNVRESISTSDVVILANQDNTEDILLGLTKQVGDKYSIKSSSICFSKVLLLAKKALDHGLDCND